MTDSFISSGRLRLSALLIAGGAALLFYSCKGRTANDMTPTGDTVEVVINSTEDSISNPITTDSTENEI